MASAPSVPSAPAAPRPSGGGGARADHWRTVAVGLVLVLGTVALFSRTLQYRFTEYDDPIYLTANLHVQGGLSWEGIRWAFAGSRIDFWQPLAWLSHMVDVELFGSRPWGHHLTSILWHAANAALAFLLLRRLTGAFWTSALAAALFAWHPLRVESVSWVTERKDVMGGCFFLLTLWSYAAYAERRAAGRPARARYALTLAAFVAALMSKPVVVVLPALLLLLDLWPLRRLALPTPGATARVARVARDCGVLLFEKVPFLALAVACAIPTLLFQHEGGAFTAEITLSGRITNAIVSIPRYLGKFLWPFDLAVLYPHPGVWPVGPVIAAGLVIVAITAAALWRFRPPASGQPWLLVGWGWFLIMLLPNVGLIQVGYQAIADRYSYLPMLGVVVGLLWTVRGSLPDRLPAWIKVGVPVLLLAACGWRTWDQQATWRDSTSLFTHTLAVTRNNYPVHAFYGYTLLTEGRTAEAEAQVQRALQINPRFSSGYEVLALVRLAQGRADEAIAAYQQLLKLTPESSGTQRELGELYLELGRPADAEAHLQAAVRINPHFALAYVSLARLELARGRPGPALADYDRALQLEPRDWALHNEVAVLLGSLGRTAESRQHFETSLRLAPRNAQTRLSFARMLGGAGQAADALEQVRQAAALRPDDPAVQLELAGALEQAGRLDEADRVFARAAQERPDDVNALCGLGRILLDRRQPAEARGRFEAALKIRPDFSPALVGLARAASQLGQTDSAASNLEAAVRAGPDDVAAVVLLGDARARQGNMADAAAQYQQALRLHPGDASIEARLGFALYLARRPAEAVRHWEEALRLDPKMTDLQPRIEQARREAGATGGTGGPPSE